IFATGQGTFCATNGPSLWKFDSNGNVLWNKKLIPPGMNFEANGGNGLFSGNRIITANLFTYETPDLDMRRGAFLSAMDGETGELISSRCYQLNDADWHYDSIVVADLYFAKAGDQKLFLLANIASENSSVDSYHITLNDDLSSSDLATEIMVKSQSFEPHSVNSRWQALPGGILSGSFGDPSDRSVQYLALVDTAYHILMQRKITLSRPAYLTSVSKTRSGPLNCIYSSTVADLSSYLFYDQISPDLISGGCNGIDTAFLTTRQIRISELNVPIRYSDAGEVTASEIHPAQSSFTLSKEIVCQQQSSCDSLRITGPDSICDNQLPARFTAFKNADCLSRTVWDIDPAAVTNIERIDDTTINISFSKDWNGWLYASLPACNKKDSLLIHAISGAGALSLGNDTSLCPQATLLLQPPPYKNYQWQDGSTGPAYLVSRAGAYSLQATDGCDFSYSGSIRVTYYDTDSSGVYYTTVCPTPPLMVQSPKTLKDYQWSPAFNLQGSDNASEVQLRAADVSEIFLSGHTPNDCLVNDTVKIQYKDCSRFIRVPNAFSPNGDGRNDYLRPLVHGQLTDYEFAVYNVWGELVFHTSNPEEGWDGRFGGVMQPPGSFVWLCKYRFEGGEEQIDKGTLVLVR
ncbi:MAG TPA: gliding motility-associated C-terminal domain-containing protein, partial [Puia sp.]|nr:gliding motility-associated C-terminal domain-containing protein [Puia sp.]